MEGEPLQHPEGSDRVCQLEVAGEGAELPGAVLRAFWWIRRHVLLFFLRLGKAIRSPSWLLKRLLGRSKGSETWSRPSLQGAGPPPLRLRPGERVRVKDRDEIEATLDGDGRFDRMAYLPAVMDRFCGGVFTVRGRVERFFDERNWKMLRLRDAVILNGVFCEPDEHLGCDWAGCQRSCFLFWKEAWLERIEEGVETGGHEGPC